MRIKFDGTLFTQEDIDELSAALNKEGILLEPELQTFKHQKGISEMMEEASSWIAAIGNDFLPAMMSVLFSFFLKHNKTDKNPVIRIEYREGGKRHKIDVPAVPAERLLKVELPVSENQTIRIDVESSTESAGQQNV